MTTRDKVRLAIGDTDPDDPLLQDAEVDRFIDGWPRNVELAAAGAAEAVAAKFARGFDVAEDGQHFSRRQRYLQYKDLAISLRRRGGSLVWPHAPTEVREVSISAEPGISVSGVVNP